MRQEEMRRGRDKERETEKRREKGMRGFGEEGEKWRGEERVEEGEKREEEREIKER